MILSSNSPEAKAIDASLDQWRQGDLVLGEQLFVHVGDRSRALSVAASELGEDGLQAVLSVVEGFAMVSQTCDIVRKCVERPYVEVSPLVAVDADALLLIQRGGRPSLATLPALAAKGLAIDLDRVMTVEKSIVATWERTPGWTSDVDARALAQALARKRARFAFPDDFNAFASKLHDRLKAKHDKVSEEGRALRALREIRVQAAPSWEAAAVELFFWFIRNETERLDDKLWAEQLKAWLQLVKPTARFTKVEGQVATLDDLTGADYVNSDQLDLDHLSSRGKPG